jgi:hypothetical protein
MIDSSHVGRKSFIKKRVFTQDNEIWMYGVLKRWAECSQKKQCQRGRFWSGNFVYWNPHTYEIRCSWCVPEWVKELYVKGE